MTDPITPEAVLAHKAAQFPDAVIEVFNDLIAEHFNGDSAQFHHEAAVVAILARGIAPSRETVFDRHWLDIEPIYRVAGWVVTYENPVFTFARPSRRRT